MRKLFFLAALAIVAFLLPPTTPTLTRTTVTTQPSRILFLSFFSGKSHRLTYLPLIQELARRGHHVTVLTPLLSSNATTTTPKNNIREIQTLDSYTEFFSKFDPIKIKETNDMMNPFRMIDLFEKICRKSYKLPEIMGLLNEKFDLISMQPQVNECALGLVYKLGSHLVLFSPAGAPNYVTKLIGSHQPFSFASHFFLGYSDEMSFAQRFVNFGFNVLFDLQMEWVYQPAMTRIYREELNDDSIPDVGEIMGNADLILSNSHFSLSGHRNHLPGVVEVGGIHSFGVGRTKTKLPEGLNRFLSQGHPKGFILFSLGTIINTNTISIEKRNIFMNTFSKLTEYGIIWKWDDSSIHTPSNIFISNWVPQEDLLRHPNIKLFITHCGLGGTEEAILNGIPMLGMPLVGDQPLNAKQAERLGILKVLDWNEITEEALLHGIQEVLENKKYRQNAEALSKIFKDQPDNPLDLAVFWLEYILRHNGAPHLKSSARKLNYFQYHSWDVIFVYVGIILSSVWLTLKFFSVMCCKMRQKVHYKQS
ncbi:UDP-glucuronosyltransferase 1-6 [Folsomia candida]|uniref:UDP-glucuronosyltransferase n=2 Tax=Folsomia candida TaxID=158441 RepID=A0A226F2R2_FOLCA|nr:UDP-glucuronosyltransferase 1-6 [Folsomia candida]